MSDNDDTTIGIHVHQTCPSCYEHQWPIGTFGYRTCPRCYAISILTARAVPQLVKARPTIQTLQRAVRKVAERSSKLSAGVITQAGTTQCAACGLSAPFSQCIDGKATEAIPGRIRGRVYRGLICADCQARLKATAMTPKDKRKHSWEISEAETIGSYTHIEMRLPEYQTATGRVKGVRAWESRVSPDDDRWPILCATDAFMRYREKYCFTAPNRLPDAEIDWQTGAGWAHSENPAWLRSDHVRLLKDFDGSIYAERVEHPLGCGCPKCQSAERKRILSRDTIAFTAHWYTQNNGRGKRRVRRVRAPYKPFRPIIVAGNGQPTEHTPYKGKLSVDYTPKVTVCKLPEPNVDAVFQALIASLLGVDVATIRIPSAYQTIAR